MASASDEDVGCASAHHSTDRADGALKRTLRVSEAETQFADQRGANKSSKLLSSALIAFFNPR
jgi:hypothetical protein